MGNIEPISYLQLHERDCISRQVCAGADEGVHISAKNAVAHALSQPGPPLP